MKETRRPSLYLIRGLPGSGKSTYAKGIDAFHIEADMFFIHNGKYEFDKNKLSLAHEWCLKTACNAMDLGMDVVVSNTFTRKWEMEKYLLHAKSTGHIVFEHTCKGNYKNIHNVPADVLERMRYRYEN